MFPLGAIITGTFYGTEAEFKASGIPARFPSGGKLSIVSNDWLTSLAVDAEHEALYLSKLATPFYSKSLAFKADQMIPANKVKEIFDWTDKQDKGTLLWFIIFDATGGAMMDVPMNATSYSHRDKILFYQSYAVGLPLAGKTKDFLTNFHNQIQAAVPSAYGTYAGYVDPALKDGQQQYWGANLAKLQTLKKRFDPTDLFHNPQSVRVGA